MAVLTKTSTAGVNAKAAALASLLDNGFLRIYDGARPATPDTAVGAHTLLAELRFANPAEDSILDGVITFDAFTPDGDANATGNASWFRALSSDGATPVFDGNVGTADADITMPAVAIQQHMEVALSSLSYTCPKA